MKKIPNNSSRVS